MRIGVTGYDGGLLGGYLRKYENVIPIEVDIRKEEQLVKPLKEVDVLIHAAAITSVEVCQEHPKEAFETNVGGTMNVVNVCSEYGIPIIYISTDHVFFGKNLLYMPNEHSRPDPVNTYGFTKYASEAMVNTSQSQTMIVRSSKLINADWLHTNGLANLKAGISIDAPKFIYKCFLHASFFADALINLAGRLGEFGLHEIMHITSPVRVSYAQFWRQVCLMELLDLDLVKERSIEFDASVDVAPRPFRGGLDSRWAYKCKIIEPIPLEQSIKLSLEEYYEKYPK